MLTPAPWGRLFALSLPARLGRVRDLIPHNGVDHLDPLPRDGLERLAVAHAPVPAAAVALAEAVVAPDQRVA